MLILDSRSEILNDPALFQAWPGPLAIRVSFEDIHSFDAAKPGLEDAVLFREASPTSSALDALRQIILTGHRYARARPAGALLFATQDASTRAVKKALKKGPVTRKNIVHTVARSGDLLFLQCSEKVVTNPLFLTYFDNMMPGLPATNTLDSLQVLQDNLDI